MLEKFRDDAVFADAHYWIAMLNPCDQWHQQVRIVSERLGKVTIVTTDEVLTEVLNAFSGYGKGPRNAVCGLLYRMRLNKSIVIVEQSRASFDFGLSLYDARNDKGYSLVDCISMNTMRRMVIQRILTADQHFAQEGFTVLIK
ncbi:MAG: nucleic acid-binding protein [Planctomycetaceae bacterium]|nr:MAG: nucleic acid-binding protein [Planctomycetaceae bacterium]